MNAFRAERFDSRVGKGGEKKIREGGRGKRKSEQRWESVGDFLPFSNTFLRAATPTTSQRKRRKVQEKGRKGGGDSPFLLPVSRSSLSGKGEKKKKKKAPGEGKKKKGIGKSLPSRALLNLERNSRERAAYA